jgi:ABC-type nitrate/sulfonate/bicarbonate transport system ATPase subunit
LNAAPTVGGSARLEVRIAEKTYPGAEGNPVTVLRDLAFSLPPGRVGALLGPSGGGKTTTLRIIAGLDRSFTGSVERPGKGRLGIVFQEPRLLPWRTVEQNVLIAVEAAGLQQGPEAALYPILGLENHRTRYPGELSLGLARRAAIARAFAVAPDLLLLDEPFVSLDDDTAARLRAELTALQARSQPTTILVTHDRNEAVALSDEVFILGGHPARVVAQLSIRPPRERRSGETILRLRSDLDALMREAGAGSHLKARMVE